MRTPAIFLTLVFAAYVFAAPTTQPSAGRLRLVLPPVIYASPGIETNVYFDNVVLVLNPANYAFVVGCDKGRQFTERWAFTPKPEDVGEHSIEIQVRDEANEFVARGTSIVRVVPQGEPTQTDTSMLIIGDSLTQAAVYPQVLLEHDAADTALNLKLIGCRGPKNAPATGPVRFEGYNGWTVQAYVTLHGPLSRTGEYKRPETGSPFMYDDAGEPKLDFARYCKQFNDGKAPDVITVCLGINDVARGTDEKIDRTIDEIFGYYDTLIAEFQKVGPQTRIGVIIPPPPSRNQDGFRNYTPRRDTPRWQFRRNQHRLAERLIEKFAGRESQNIYLVPVYVNLDTERNYPTFTAPAHAASSQPAVRTNDGVHPSPAGYRQIGDTIFCWVKAVTSQ